MEHIQKTHMEHLYGHLLGLDDDTVNEFLTTKLLITCDICRPKEIITFKAKSALNRHNKRFHAKKGQLATEGLKLKIPSKRRFSNEEKCSVAPTIKNSYSLRVTSSLAQKIWGEGGNNPSSVSSIKQESNTQPEPFPLTVIKEQFECSLCFVKFPCPKELESHWTICRRHYIHYSGSPGTQTSVERGSTDILADIKKEIHKE